MWVADPKAAAEGYIRLFGAEAQSEKETPNGLRVTLRLGGVLLFIETMPQGMAAAHGAGLEHFALLTPDFDGIITHLREAGAEFLSEAKIIRPNARMIFVAAPGGGRVEIIERP